MNDIREIMPFLILFTGLTSHILALVLIYSTETLIGRNWLAASVSLALLTVIGFQTLNLLARTSLPFQVIGSFYDVVGLFPLFSTACLGVYLFANWSHSRIDISMWHLLFSFSGRIPRSTFWIMICILFPLGTMVGIAPYVIRGEGIGSYITLAIYGVWMILSMWISLALYAKRWHDCDKSGWMTLVLLIPVIGVFWFFGVCGFMAGTSGENRFGENPLMGETG